jgi:hypothetical protein
MMIYLAISMVLLGFIGLILGAERPNIMAVIGPIEGILLAVFWIIKKVKGDDYPSTYCDDTCPACGGSKKVKFTVGLGRHCLVPSYMEVSCSNFVGSGKRRG